MIKITLVALNYYPEKICDQLWLVAKKFDESTCGRFRSWGSMEIYQTLVASATQGIYSIYNNRLRDF